MKRADELLALVESGVAGLGLDRRTPVRLYAPMAYILGLRGKRIRPVLALLAYQALTDEPVERCLKPALALELFHNFSLIHDDIMDNAPTRRGEPTVHARWDANTAILAGDALFAYTLELVAGDFPDRAAALISAYARIALDVCEGQMRDMEQAEQSVVTLDEYLEMIRQKTAVLIGGALRIGAVAAGANAEVQDQLDEYGQTLGLAFQLQDDYLDLYGEQAEVGKQIGGDILENKKTFLWLHALANGNHAQQAELAHWCAPDVSATADPSAKVAAVRQIFDATGVPEAVRHAIDARYAHADMLAGHMGGADMATGSRLTPLTDYFQRLRNRIR